ncbi:MAG: hypothetical protein PHR25_00030 [Clostridia bacterium]|nr:hypothetical protein [Clostridia bacterium]MDD4375162.1 hypothetical protein [Clostridia bacterium]
MDNYKSKTRITLYIIIIILSFVLINKIFFLRTLKIDIRKAEKRNTFELEEEISPINYIETFVDDIKSKRYVKAMDKVDKNNLEEQFKTDVKIFENKLDNIFKYNDTFIEKIDYIITSTRKKEKYTDTEIICNFYYITEENINKNIIKFIVREYDLFDYKLFIINMANTTS